jgi:hypothetical protein
MWYDESRPYLKELKDENFILKIRTLSDLSSEYCIYKVNRLLTILQKEGILKKEFVFNDEYLNIEKMSSDSNSLTIQIPLSILNDKVECRAITLQAGIRVTTPHKAQRYGSCVLPPLSPLPQDNQANSSSF